MKKVVGAVKLSTINNGADSGIDMIFEPKEFSEAKWVMQSKTFNKDLPKSQAFFNIPNIGVFTITNPSSSINELHDSLSTYKKIIERLTKSWFKSETDTDPKDLWKFSTFRPRCAYNFLLKPRKKNKILDEGIIYITNSDEDFKTSVELKYIYGKNINPDLSDISSGIYFKNIFKPNFLKELRSLYNENKFRFLQIQRRCTEDFSFLAHQSELSELKRDDLISFLRSQVKKIKNQISYLKSFFYYTFEINKRIFYRNIFHFMFKNLDDESSIGYFLNFLLYNLFNNQLIYSYHEHKKRILKH